MEIRRLSDIFLYQNTKAQQKAALGTKKGLGWRFYSTEECLANIKRVCVGLLNIGLSKGDKIVLISDTGSPAWLFLDLACHEIGLVVIPLSSDLSPSSIEFIFRETDAKCCILENENVKMKIQKIYTPKYLYSFSRLPDIPHWTELLQEPMSRHLVSIDSLRAAIHEDDLASIIYTNAETSIPKGIMLSHKNILATVKGIITKIALKGNKTAFSCQAPHYVFERVLLYAYIITGCELLFKTPKETISKNLKTLRPHYWGAQPEMLEEVYASIRKQTQKGKGISKYFSPWAIKIGSRYKGRNKITPLYWIQLKIADLLVFRSWRRMLGDRIQGIIIQTDRFGTHLTRIFSASGIEVLESFGRNELSGILALNPVSTLKSRIDKVGSPLDGMMVRINKVGEHDIGEIHVKGNGVMLGYFNDPDATSKVFTEDGWLKLE